MFESVTTVLLFVPFILIIFLANLADTRRLAGDRESALAGLTYLLHLVIFGGLAACGVLLQALGLLMNISGDRADILDILSSQGAAQSDDILFILDNLDRLGVSLWAPALAALLLLLPPVRRRFARLIPIDPRSAVHAVALSFVMLIVINLTFTLAIGLDTLANLTEAEGSSTDSASLLASLWAQQLTFALWALIGVGWLTRRKWLQSLERLGLVIPGPVEIGIGVGAGLLSVAVILLLEAGASAVGLRPDENVERLSEVLFGSLMSSIPGILTLGLAAGIGEETLFRGALQPRFGLIFTSLLFALIHSQYGITLSTLAVLIVGLLLGLLRIRFNTTTCAIAHASYNITLGLLALLAQQVV